MIQIEYRNEQCNEQDSRGSTWSRGDQARSRWICIRSEVRGEYSWFKSWLRFGGHTVKGKVSKGRIWRQESLRHSKDEGWYTFNNKRKLLRHCSVSMQIFYWFFKDFAHARNAFLQLTATIQRDFFAAWRHIPRGMWLQRSGWISMRSAVNVGLVCDVRGGSIYHVHVWKNVRSGES